MDSFLLHWLQVTKHLIIYWISTCVINSGCIFFSPPTIVGIAYFLEVRTWSQGKNSSVRWEMIFPLDFHSTHHAHWSNTFKRSAFFFKVEKLNFSVKFIFTKKKFSCEIDFTEKFALFFTISSLLFGRSDGRFPRKLPVCYYQNSVMSQSASS